MSQIAVDLQIPNIEKELNKRPDGKGHALGVAKACLFTLVIFAKEKRRVDYLQGLVNTILDKFPCRIIFIQGDEESGTPYCRVSVSSVKSKQNSAELDTSIVCDQIMIQATTDQFFRIPFIVVPHIVPDLPVYLLWGNNPFSESVIFPQLQKYATRVIFDSECSDNIPLFCREMQNKVNHTDIDIMDVSWALVSSWRDVLAQLFESPDKVEQLYKIKSIVIRYNASDAVIHPEIRSLYLQSWLASCLNWQYNLTERYKNSVVIGYAGYKHPAVIAITAEKHDDLPPGAIHQIEISLSDGQSYVILRKPELAQALVHAGSNETCELPFTLSLPNVHKGFAFMREIFFSKLGTHYNGMLKVLSQVDVSLFSEINKQ